MKKIILNILILTYAFWGSLLLVWIEYVLANPKTPNMMGPEKPNTSLLLLPHILLLLASAFPIFMWEKQIGIKVSMLIIYYLLAVIVAFYILYIGLIGIYGWNN